MRAWFAADGHLDGATGVTSVGRAVGSFVAWADGDQVATAPELLRATAFDPFTVTIRLPAGERERLAAAVERDRSLALEGNLLRVGDVVAVERVLDTYPAAFERLFTDATGDVALERRGGDRLVVDGELREITTD